MRTIVIAALAAALSFPAAQASAAPKHPKHHRSAATKQRSSFPANGIAFRKDGPISEANQGSLNFISTECQKQLGTQATKENVQLCAAQILNVTQTHYGVFKGITVSGK